jgi:hypothetical protein
MAGLPVGEILTDGAGSGAMRRRAVLVLTVVGPLGFFLLNLVVPRFVDDYCRFLPTLDLATILSAVLGDYLTWTGRFPVMLINRLVFASGDVGLLLFNIANAVCLWLASLLVLRLVLPPRQGTAVAAQTLILFLFLFWFSPHRFGEFTLWKTGAIQYFWGSTIALGALVLLWRWLFAGDERPTGRASLISTPILFFIGGAWLENLSVAVMVAIVVMLAVRFFLQKQPVPVMAVVASVCWGLGLLVLVGAPGNYVRAEIIGDPTPPLGRLLQAAGYAYTYFSLELAVAFGVAGLLLFFLRPVDWQTRILKSALCALVGVASMAAMVGAPAAAFVGRAAFAYEFFLICSVMCLVPLGAVVTTTNGTLRVTSALVSLALLAVLATQSILAFQIYRGVSAQELMRGEIMAMAKESETTDAVGLPPLYFGELHSTALASVNTGPYFARDILGDPRHWRNVCYARARGVAAVKLTVIDSE